MSFEAEVIPLFLVCAGTVSILELITGCLLLKKQKAARSRLIGHVVSMAIALFFLARCIFANWLGFHPPIASISNSACIGLFGIFWAVSVYFFLSIVVSLTEKEA